jgi:D-alanyl-lipoteichoic acid acyltransferase DltB (MBOAT superfamily)
MSFTVLWAWGSGLLLSFLSDDRKRKLIILASLVVNLGILGVFKYYDFFIENAVSLLSMVGLTVHTLSLKVILPVGISFYTFQALGYVIDVYRKDITPTKDVVAFLAFVSFFPQLVAGPIERAGNLLPQFLKPRCFDYAFAVDGARQMLWGFFKKMVIADGCAPLVNQIFANFEFYSGSERAIGAVLFAFQIYGDFSGYSDIAIGCAKLFGIKLQCNFRTPYFSRNIAEFWRRWHISLNTWFRDYLYIPLGGSRCGTTKIIRNILIVFIVSGLWHGANYTFIVWGLIHGCLFLPLILLGKNRKDELVHSGETHLWPSWREFAGIVMTFCCVTLAWIVFRSPDIMSAGRFVAGIFSASLFKAPGFARSMFPWIAFLVVVEWFCRRKPHPLWFSSNAMDGRIGQHFMRIGLYLSIVVVCMAHTTRNAEFIYFQF